jgi:hypothetical protein
MSDTAINTPAELLQRALADAIAMSAVAVSIEIMAADGSTWIYRTTGMAPVSEWCFGASELAS